MGSLKQLVPLPVRNGLRPIYGSLRKRLSKAWAAVKPAPNDWKEVGSQLRSRTHSALELYRIAQREFEVQQLEPEILGLLAFVADRKPAIVGEIGLKHGGNSFLFTQVFRDLGLFVGLDLILPDTNKLRYLAPRRQQHRYFEGSSYAPSTVKTVREFLGSRRFDFLFIDGDHSYQGVLDDFLCYVSMVRPGGLVAFHDIVPDDAGRGRPRPTGSHCDGGEVYLFWQKVKEHFPHREFVASWDQTAFGIGVITLPEMAIDDNEQARLSEQLRKPA